MSEFEIAYYIPEIKTYSIINGTKYSEHNKEYFLKTAENLDLEVKENVVYKNGKKIFILNQNNDFVLNYIFNANNIDKNSNFLKDFERLSELKFSFDNYIFMIITTNKNTKTEEKLYIRIFKDTKVILPTYSHMLNNSDIDINYNHNRHQFYLNGDFNKTDDYKDSSIIADQFIFKKGKLVLTAYSINHYGSEPEDIGTFFNPDFPFNLEEEYSDDLYLLCSKKIYDYTLNSGHRPEVDFTYTQKLLLHQKLKKNKLNCKIFTS